jgi:hypothetical protein
MATNGHVKLCTQSRLAETDCRAFRPMLVWSVTPSEAKQIQNCCQNPWIASSPCGLAMTVGDPTKIGTPFSSASSSCCGGSTCGAAWVWVWRHRPIVQPNHRRPPPGKAPLWFHSRTRRQGPGPQIPISPSWRARELFFFHCVLHPWTRRTIVGSCRLILVPVVVEDKLLRTGPSLCHCAGFLGMPRQQATGRPRLRASGARRYDKGLGT